MEVPADQLAVDDDERPIGTQVLASLQGRVGPVRQIQMLAQTSELPQQRASVLLQVVLGRGDMETALRIEHVLPPGLIEAERNIVIDPVQGFSAGGTETPGTQPA